MIEHFPLMVPGARPSARLATVTAPFDGTPIATVETGDETAAETALATAHALFRNRDAWLPAWQRVDILERAVELMHERRDHLAIEAAREGGKPLIDSRHEVARAIDGLKLCIEGIRTQHGAEVPMGITRSSVGRAAFTRLEPIGVVVAVSAFNHPLNLIVHQVGPAVAAGCPVIVKPAENTPLSCLRFVGILREAGLPDSWCQPIVTATRPVAEALVIDKRVGFFSFIGSAAVGWSLRAKLAPGARCALEHGGVAPAIVAADADLDVALPKLAKGGFYHAGQVCVSVQRVFAHHTIARRVAEDIAALGAKMKVGDPTLPDTEIGPLIRPAEVERIHAWVEEARKGGGTVLSGGAPLTSTCYPATVIYAPPASARLSTLEAFGPVISVYPYAELDDALARANALDVAFQAAVFTGSLDTALRCYRRLDASAVMINDHTAFRVDWMPFAGLRHSGHGVGGIHHTMREMQIEKMMVLNSEEL